MTDTLTITDLLDVENLPPFWNCANAVLSGMDALQITRWRPRSPTLHTFLTLDNMDDGAGIWLHSSTSARTKRGPRIPTWDELKEVHQVVHGDRPVVQLLPPKAHWVSSSECLHLFERLDADTVPDGLWRQDR